MTTTTDKPAEDINSVFEDILSKASFAERSKGMFGIFRQPTQGQYLIVGQGGAPMLQRIGYVVQIRVKQGAFGSDIYILRHADHTVAQHANNMYIPMTEEEIERVKPFFGFAMPENEDFEHGFTLGGPDTLAAGFLIDPPEGFQTRGGGGSRMRTTVKDADGNESVTDTVFL